MLGATEAAPKCPLRPLVKKKEYSLKSGAFGGKRWKRRRVTTEVGDAFLVLPLRNAHAAGRCIVRVLVLADDPTYINSL